MAISIQEGDIVWINGPFPCGEWPDLRIARESLIHALDQGEFYLADSGYFDGNNWSVTPNGLNNMEQRQQSLVRARHETLNRRFKQFRALSQRFRHDLKRHRVVFYAIANITQVMNKMGHARIFHVEYNDNS